MERLPKLPAGTKKEIFKQALGVADWMVRTQVKLEKPFWDANRGRFIYTRRRTTGQTVRGIGWTQARGIMVLLTAYQATRNPAYRAAAQLAADYLRGMQQTASNVPLHDGIIWEEIPFSDHVYVRDTSEVAETFCYLYKVTGDDEWLWRADVYFSWYLRHGVDMAGWPVGDVRLPSGEQKGLVGSYQIGNGKFLYRLWQATGDAKALNRGLRPIVKRAMAEFFSPQGGMYANPLVRSADAVKDSMAHHGGRGGEAHLTLNDDGAGVALLGAYRATKQEAIFEQLEKYAAWTLTKSTPLPTFSGYVSMGNFMVDMYRQTGRKEYLEWVLDNLNAGLLRLRITDRKSEDYGAIRGEDEPAKWYWGGRQDEYTCMRTNAYAAMLLFKLSDPRNWCPGYSAFGWDELKTWPRDRFVAPSH
jgi:hypothetical protein